MLNNITKIIEENDNVYYSMIISIFSFIPTIVFNTLYFVPILLFITFIILLNICIYKENKIKEKLFIENNIKDKIQETNDYRNKIEKIVSNSFKETEFQDIFDKKIFTIIDMLSNLNNDNLKGEAQYRVQNIINNSLKIYLINIDSASKMIIAHNDIDINFKEEILSLLNQNKMILNKLKEFVMKLILLNVNTKEFSDLINSFENSIKSLDIIKNIRKDL